MFNESQAHVGTKNVSDLLDSVVNNITKMLQTKIDAVNVNKQINLDLAQHKCVFKCNLNI